MIYGYARVSTKDQVLNLQIDALKNAGCQKIFNEVAKGAKADRPEWLRLLSEIQKGDTLIVWKLDRMGRSLHHLIKVVNDLIAKGVDIISIQDPLNTTSAQGRLIFNMFASLAEFEKDLIRERTMAGLKSARARGRIGGRPKGLSEKAKKVACVAEALYLQNELKTDDIAEQLGISKTTLYKYLRARNVQIGVPIN
jgi:DNA invertase Pin-like site-specific DNA recombinase